MLIAEREAHVPRQATAAQRMSGDHGLEAFVTDAPHVGGRPRVTAQGVDGVREQQVARILVIPVERQLQASIEERSVDTQVVLQRFLPRQVRVRTRVGESQPRLSDVSHIAGAIGVEVVVIADPLLVARIADGSAELEIAQRFRLGEESLLGHDPPERSRREVAHSPPGRKLRRGITPQRRLQQIAVGIVQVHASEERLEGVLRQGRRPFRDAARRVDVFQHRRNEVGASDKVVVQRRLLIAVTEERFEGELVPLVEIVERVLGQIREAEAAEVVHVAIGAGTADGAAWEDARLVHEDVVAAQIEIVTQFGEDVPSRLQTDDGAVLPRHLLLLIDQRYGVVFAGVDGAEAAAGGTHGIVWRCGEGVDPRRVEVAVARGTIGRGGAEGDVGRDLHRATDAVREIRAQVVAGVVRLLHHALLIVITERGVELRLVCAAG